MFWVKDIFANVSDDAWGWVKQQWQKRRYQDWRGKEKLGAAQVKKRKETAWKLSNRESKRQQDTDWRGHLNNISLSAKTGAEMERITELKWYLWWASKPKASACTLEERSPFLSNVLTTTLEQQKLHKWEATPQPKMDWSILGTELSQSLNYQCWATVLVFFGHFCFKPLIQLNERPRNMDTAGRIHHNTTTPKNVSSK